MNAKFTLYLLMVFGLTYSQSHYRAPNSYIFDIAQPSQVKGIYIPVKKAYDVWYKNQYLEHTKLPPGVQSATVMWEDIPGLIRELSIEGSGENAKIKVEVNRAKGKGNAVVAFKIDRTVYWSWHVWVTDDPNPATNTSVDSTDYTYSPVHQRDINGEMQGRFKFMDRNLGATSNTFLGNEWNKSGGLMYQYGRKDPLPAFINKDGSYYEVEGEGGNVRHVYHAQLGEYSTHLNVVTTDEAGIEANIKKAVNNPMLLIVNMSADQDEPWYSNSLYREGSTTQNDDLWADNTEGRNDKQDMNMKLKSPFDPCPNGWRVPSFNHQLGTRREHSPWGRMGTSTSTDNIDEIFPDKELADNDLRGLKIYPNLGSDFTGTVNRNLGKYSLSGKYDFYQGNPLATSFFHQDITTEGPIMSANLSYAAETRVLSIINDIARFDKGNGLGLHYLNSHGNGGKNAMAVRCVRDFNFKLTKIENNNVENYDFPTEYFSDNSLKEESDGLELPNTYVIMTNTEDLQKSIPIKKAFAVYNQVLTDHENLPTTGLKASLLWATNKDLLKKVVLVADESNYKDSRILLDFNENEVGNAVIGLEDAAGRVVWSWHIWVPKDDPLDPEKQMVYKTENERPMVNTVGYTNSGAPPIETRFMDRNLGAISAFPSGEINSSNEIEAQQSGGMFYQWGRKDPLPSFKLAGNSGSYEIYKPSLKPDGTIDSWETITSTDYQSQYVSVNEASMVESQNISRSNKLAAMYKFSAENPLTIIVETDKKDWVSSISGLENERWGHAKGKSVFDPCPQGWRVPDMTFVSHVSTKDYPSYLGAQGSQNFINSRGTSPWYFADGKVYEFDVNKLSSAALNDISKNPLILDEINNAFRGVPQNNPYSVQNQYLGKKVMRNTNNLYGWVFDDAKYRLGGYPVTGILNYQKQVSLPLFNDVNITGLWTAAPSSFQRGDANAIIISNNVMLTNTDIRHRMYPQTALNVRCVQHLDIYRGSNGYENNDDEDNDPDIDPPVVDPDTPIVNPPKVGNVGGGIKNANDFKMLPNPVRHTLTGSKTGSFKYQINNISGLLVKSGSSTNSKINVEGLLEGVYIVTITHEDGSVTQHKIIKQ